jgi:hypothetical protein
MVDFNRLKTEGGCKLSKKQEIQNMFDSLGFTVPDTLEGKRRQKIMRKHQDVLCSMQFRPAAFY